MGADGMRSLLQPPLSRVRKRAESIRAVIYSPFGNEKEGNEGKRARCQDFFATGFVLVAVTTFSFSASQRNVVL